MMTPCERYIPVEKCCEQAVTHRVSIVLSLITSFIAAEPCQSSSLLRHTILAQSCVSMANDDDE